MDAMHVMVVAAVFTLAGAVKGVTGMGLPTVAVSLLGLWTTPGQAAALLVIPSLATNLAQCRGPHLRELSARLWPMWLAMAGVTVLAPDLGSLLPALSAHRVLGVVLVLYGVFGLYRPILMHIASPSAGLSTAVGATTGLVIAATAVFVLPMVPFLQSLRLQKESMVQAMGLSFTVATVALAARVQSAGEVLASPSTLLAVVMAFIGLQAGTRARAHVGAEGFQRMLFLAFLGLGVANLLRGGSGGA